MGKKYDKYGMVLLRNRFFKSACFNCSIQRFFKDAGITDIRRLHGQTAAEDISDIKIITTPSSVKYLKFGSPEAWLNMTAADCMFGVVKHEKSMRFFDGEMVQTHYQLLNTLQLTQKEVDELTAPSLEFAETIRNDPAAFRYYIKYKYKEKISAAQSASDVVYQMLGVTDEFSKTEI
jgi:hypothetical protein